MDTGPPLHPSGYAFDDYLEVIQIFWISHEK